MRTDLVSGQRRHPTRIGVSLLLRRSGGCSRTYGFRLQDGVLVAN